MKSLKSTILILILLTLGLVGWGCFKKPVVNQNENANVDTNQNLNTNVSQKVTLSEPDEDGWRTHINPLAGFMFKFQDPGKKITIQPSSKNRSTFIEDNGTKDGMYLYINRYDYDLNSYQPDKPTSFRDLIEKYVWRDADSAVRLISLKKITYPNIEEGYIAVIEYNFGYIGHAIFILDPNKSNEYVRMKNMKAELYTQILQTFQFLPLP